MPIFHPLVRPPRWIHVRSELLLSTWEGRSSCSKCLVLFCRRPDVGPAVVIAADPDPVFIRAKPVEGLEREAELGCSLLGRDSVARSPLPIAWEFAAVAANRKDALDDSLKGPVRKFRGRLLLVVPLRLLLLLLVLLVAFE
jgi:hypothetical protein